MSDDHDHSYDGGSIALTSAGAERICPVPCCPMGRDGDRLILFVPGKTKALKVYFRRALTITDEVRMWNWYVIEVEAT